MFSKNLVLFPRNTFAFNQIILQTYLENFNSEVWQNLNFFEEDSPESEEERQKLEYIVDEERFFRIYFIKIILKFDLL